MPSWGGTNLSLSQKITKKRHVYDDAARSTRIYRVNVCLYCRVWLCACGMMCFVM